MKLMQILDGLTFGQKQEVGTMAVFPLLGKDATAGLAPLEALEFIGTSGYGSMVFHNPHDKPCIVPTGYAIITKQAAQDHALTFASLIPPMTRREINKACCIQETQGGYIDGSGITDFAMLPLYIRKRHLKEQIFPNSNETVLQLDERLSFSRLWRAISDFQRELVGHSAGNLVCFFNKFMDKLMQFNAEFETVPNQRGAVIMMNGKVVGIEVAPTQEYWQTIWKSLIRDCYGAEVLRQTLLNPVQEFKEFRQQELVLDDCKTLAEIKAAVSAYKTHQRELGEQAVKEKLSGQPLFLKDTVSLLCRNSFDTISYQLFKVQNEDTYGELYVDNDKVVYASVLC